jgi:small-conductance mechanosensitive channel
MPRLSVLLCTMALLVLAAGCSEPPQKEIDRAQQAIDAARAAGAEQYAPETFAAAAAALKQSHEAVDQRDYRLALSRAVDASDRAQDAAREAADNKTNARRETEATINAANAALMQLEARIKTAEAGRVPPREIAPARTTVKDAAAALQKARAALSAEDLTGARTAVEGLEEEIRSEIRVVEAATTLRTARRPVRKR